ncbi:MdtA/MuxA family multidrug efflux RND transporter periplasmic adaptor subunit [Morganella morganii]|uniref:MdtA/MuxA family multidrug efflux RND transporter periplasmic adaptor subunit n=1 Tax=Morganella morganii TaxID=582 RepID=UPI0024BBAAE3|nr:MdtA/MuxA family multidrug efflux RND transporter periplasmic adaptor subunit [Morganella morganii]ELB1545919.1 MdtA/MuxA family multidrug efflux RND transporter periplasmic adaptor subunit [Morganella morganii]HDS6844173.1 MdtA/MuxA family multidrug efflux RND transporter periplasmic adaptor subunit [Morganella morganii subsp. morganii]
MNNVQKRKKRTGITIAVLLLGAAGYGTYHYFHSAAPATPPAAGKPGASAGKNNNRPGRPPLAPVQVAKAVSETIPRTLSALGTVQAANSVTVTSRVEGQLMQIHFEEGQKVNAGDLLFTIDPRPFEIQLAQAQGQLAKDQATLANARRDLSRYQKLAATHVISQQELDTQQALVKSAEAGIKVDQAAIDSAKLQLTYSRITAPISGKMGLRQVDTGNFITAGTAMPLVVINQTAPADVLFTVPENDIPLIRMAQRTLPDLAVTALSKDNSIRLAQGKLLTLDNQSDAATGTVKAKARFTNDDDLLFPNQFVNVLLQVGQLENAVVIPNAALQMGTEGNYVWLLEADNKVRKQIVDVELQTPERVVIKSGVSTGDTLVTDGIDRLTDGAQVEVVSGQKKAAAGDKA